MDTTYKQSNLYISITEKVFDTTKLQNIFYMKNCQGYNHKKVEL